MDFPFTDDALHNRALLRQASLAYRNGLDANTHASLAARVQGHLQKYLEALKPAPQSIGFCWPWKGEVDLRPLLLAWQARAPQRRLALPVVVGKQQPLIFRLWWSEAPMVLDAMGLPVPDQTPCICPSLLLIPGQAFDINGFRLGYGGGYFDRTLALLAPRPKTVGLCFEQGRVTSVYPQPHDIPLDGFITEAGFWACAASS
jgi:5-formyltetrahydrofolate cyclo-ligase